MSHLPYCLFIQPCRPYRHFSGKLYYVHDICEADRLTNELYVHYQALYPPYQYYTIPLGEFAEEVGDEQPNNVTNQKYKFELYTGEN